MALENELVFFNLHRIEWCETHREQFVVVQDDTLMGFFPTWEDALISAYSACDFSRPLLIKEVLEQDRVYFIGAAA